MLARLMLRPTGFVKQAWRLTLRRPAPLLPESVSTHATPLWPDRYLGSGMSLCAVVAPVAAAPAVAETVTPTTSFPVAQNYAASYLHSHAP